MQICSKFAAVCNEIFPVVAMHSAAVAMFVVALNSTRKRRRNGGNVALQKLPPGGLGSKHPHKKRPMRRYELQTGKAAWILQPERTKFFLD